jgi:aminopeptidase-like protein
MPSMMRVLQDLAPLNRMVCCRDYDRAIDYLADLLPFKVIEYGAADEYNGWVIPPRWDVRRAEIRRDGRLVYDGMNHPLAVIALSAPFQGRVELDELRRHLHFDHRYDDSIPFHFRQTYRTWSRDWGFCVPRTLYDGLKPGEYDVVIETEESEGTLRMLELTLPGASDEVIVFGANLDHPGVANDGMAGVVVGMELFRRLSGRQTRFSYRLVLSQGIIGSEYYLGKQVPEHREKIAEGVFLEMLGSDTLLGFQASREGRSNIEYAVTRALKESTVPHRTGPFESIILNDEYIWEAYGIPMASLSRFPYPEYHSSRDDLSIMREERLTEAADVLEGAVDILETSRLISRRFEGNVCLSNPRYDLYVDVGQVAFGEVVSEDRRRMRLLMDLIPTLDRPVTSRSLAERVGLPEERVLAYLRKWQEKELLEIL